MKKLLIITNRISLSGSTIHVLELVQSISKLYDVKVIAGTLEPEEESALHLFEKAGIRPIIIKEMIRSVNFSQDRIAYKKIIKEIQSFKPDIVHTHTSKAGALGRLAAKSENIPNIIHTFHGTIFEGHFNALKSYAYKVIERYLAKKTTTIVALSESQNDDLSIKYKIAPPSKIVTIPLGLDIEKYTLDKAQKRQLFRKEFGISDDVVTIGIVGRLVKIKDHSLFVRTIKEIQKRTTKKVTGIIVGDGEERREISRTILDHEMSFSTSGTGDFIFTSWRLDMDVVLAGLDMVMVTSINEGTPVCIIEGQAAGVPVVSVDVGGIKDIVSKESALLSKKRSVKALAGLAMSLIDDDHKRAAMIEACKIQSEAFTIDAMINKLDVIYKNETS